VKDHLDAIQRRAEVILAQVELMKGEALALPRLRQVRLFDGARVVRNERIDSHDIRAVEEQRFAEMRANETRRACHHTTHVR
jgi:hypothetical protein